MAYEQYSTDLFEGARKKIMPFLISKNVTEIEEMVMEIVEALDGRRPNGKKTKEFDEWSVDELLSAQGRLSLLRVNLGVLASESKSRTNYSTRYKIYQTSKEWQPIKTNLEKEFNRLQQKMLKGDIESALVEAFWETTQKEVFLQEISDRLVTLYESTNQVLTAIKFKINSLMREQSETRNYESNTRQHNSER